MAHVVRDHEFRPRGISAGILILPRVTIEPHHRPDQGEIVESGQVWSVFSNPQQQITQELLNFEQVNLPFELSQTILPQSTHQILKLKYVSESKSVPDLYELLDGFNSPVQVYHSQINTIQQRTIGSLIIGIRNLDFDPSHSQSEKHPAITQLEVIGYVQSTH